MACQNTRERRNRLREREEMEMALEERTASEDMNKDTGDEIYSLTLTKGFVKYFLNSSSSSFFVAAAFMLMLLHRDRRGVSQLQIFYRKLLGYVKV